MEKTKRERKRNTAVVSTIRVAVHDWMILREKQRNSEKEKE